MLKKHFLHTKALMKVLKSPKSKNATFCESCLGMNPEIEDGYTACCNERQVDKEEALGNAKQTDIQAFLDTKFECYSHGGGRRKTFVLEKKDKEFTIDTQGDSIEYIIDTVKREIKGLRSDFKKNNTSPKM